MAKRLSDPTAADYSELLAAFREVPDPAYAQDAAQRFVEALFERFGASLVLLRLFLTVRYDRLPQEERRFVDGRGRDTNTSHLIHGGTPVFTLLGTRGERQEWNDRTSSSHFRCIPLASTAFVSSLSMLSRQLESVGLDLEMIDDWEKRITATGRADRYCGRLYIRDAAIDRDSHGRMIVPKQDFVAAHGVKSVFGFGSGYGNYPSLATLFAFANEELTEHALEPFTDLLEAFVSSTGALVGEERFFAEN
jgi:hypothetical protein